MSNSTKIPTAYFRLAIDARNRQDRNGRIKVNELQSILSLANTGYIKRACVILSMTINEDKTLGINDALCVLFLISLRKVRQKVDPSEAIRLYEAFIEASVPPTKIQIKASTHPIPPFATVFKVADDTGPKIMFHPLPVSTAIKKLQTIGINDFWDLVDEGKIEIYNSGSDELCFPVVK